MHEDKNPGLTIGFDLKPAAWTTVNRTPEDGDCKVDGVNLIRGFLKKPEYRFAFQPIIGLSSGQVIGYELLSRIFHKGDPVDSEHFFSLAHASNLAVDVDRLIVGAVMDILPTLSIPHPVFINVDPQSLADRPIQDMLLSLPTNRVIEVTERGDWDASSFHDFFDAWRARGGRLALDDFGSGYSGLEKLVVTEPDYVKLDHRLIRGSHESRAQQNIIGAMSQLAGPLGFQLLGEGIETVEELFTCMNLGVTLGQGYFFARPQAWNELLPVEEAVRHRVLQYHHELYSVYNAAEMEGWTAHRALVEKLLDAADAQGRVRHIVSALFDALRPYSVSCLKATSSGFEPMVTLGHAHLTPISLDAPSLAQKAFLSGRLQVVQGPTQEPLGTLNQMLGTPASVAIVPVGKPHWGVLGVDYKEPYAWGKQRLNVLMTLAKLMTLVLPAPPSA